MNPPSPVPDLLHELQKHTSCDVRSDLATRLLYSTDASIYQVEPLAVAIPRTQEDLSAAVELCARYRVPLLPRGAGSSLAGQAIGPALILDLSRHLDHLVEIDPEQRTATVEPGLVLNALNRVAARHGLMFGPDPASAERATLGGSLANNASGAHSILYGMAADHLLSAEVLVADGQLSIWEEIPLAEAERRARLGEGSDRTGLPVEAQIYRAALRIRQEGATSIQAGWPQTWRRASGYSLNYLIPWSSSPPPQWQEGTWQAAFQHPLPYPPVREGCLNLAPLLAGSEGTLGVIRRATIRLVPRPRATILAVLSLASILDACDAVPALLSHGPSAVELIPQSIIRLARSIPAYAHQLGFVQGDPAALLVVEFSGDNAYMLRERALNLGGEMLLAETPAQQRQVWGVRQMGLGIIQSRTGDSKPVSIIEDLAVPVERLSEFVAEMESILRSHGTTADMYAHASAGCLHIRPMVNLKDAGGVTALRAIATQAVTLTLRLGGSVSGEHGDGMARSEWLERMYGTEITGMFRELKGAADPHLLLNPGKIVDAPLMDANLRYADYEYSPQTGPHTWQTVFDYSRQSGLSGAIEQCNGAGVCRKAEGVMCPSFQASREEMNSTRGRANLLRAMISGKFPDAQAAEKTVYAALDLCLACKGCQAECPSGVDMAKLKYEFMHRYYQAHRRRLRDYIFGFIGRLAPLGRPFTPLANAVLGSQALLRAAGPWVGLAPDRPLPRFARRPLSAELRRLDRRQTALPAAAPAAQVLFLSDAFTEFFHPDAGLAAIRALRQAGCEVIVLPVLGAGRTLISKGFLDAAQQHARRLLNAIVDLDPKAEMAVVGVEPSEIFTLRDEFRDLLPVDRQAAALARRAWMIDEFLVRPDAEGGARVLRLLKNGNDGSVLPGAGRKVLLHGHCYQKAQPPADDGYATGVNATVEMLRAVGYLVEVIESGCCGMAGAFGYEVEHYEMSMQVGELALLPKVRAAGAEVIIAASGISCQAQIEDGVGRKVRHPVELIVQDL